MLSFVMQSTVSETHGRRKDGSTSTLQYGGNSRVMNKLPKHMLSVVLGLSPCK
jgi:hypothetical protein